MVASEVSTLPKTSKRRRMNDPAGNTRNILGDPRIARLFPGGGLAAAEARP